MHTYCCSDLHGQYTLFEMVRDKVIKEDSFCYVLGDCVDRGPDGFKILKEVLEDTKHFCLLCGNHEDLFIDSIKKGYCTRLHDINGGYRTIQQWEEYGKDVEYLDELKNLPYYVEYTNKKGQRIFLSHSGFNIREDFQMSKCKDDYIWDRDHLDWDWNNDAESLKNVILVHGHTPIPYMDRYCYDYRKKNKGMKHKGVVFYCEDNEGQFHKVNIDCGGFFTGELALLDLDTWEQHLMIDESIPNEREVW